ncbi:hypothetical protein IPH92_00250 [Candidatus Kaiserbacteria bacterium]|nr:MAG: hypothetical protein IPH92_00250 [Candidatus Kaiserbacteria bacterium]
MLDDAVLDELCKTLHRKYNFSIVYKEKFSQEKFWLHILSEGILLEEDVDLACRGMVLQCPPLNQAKVPQIHISLGAFQLFQFPTREIAFA